MFIRPARSSSFEPDEVEPADDSEADWLDERDCMEAGLAEPGNAASTGPVRAWQQVWTANQIADLDDLASYLDYIWEVTDERE